MTTLEIYAVGTPVIIGENIHAIVVSVLIGEGDVQYNCAWWDGRNHYVQPFIESEITAVKPTEKTEIGFRRNGVASTIKP